MAEEIKLIHITQLLAGENIRNFAKVTKAEIQAEIEKSKRPNSVNIVNRIDKMLRKQKSILKNNHEKESDIIDLAQSIRKNGLLQPLIVTENKNEDGTLRDTYTVVAGHRRFFSITNIIPLILQQEKREYIKKQEGTKKQKEEKAEELYKDELMKFESIPCKVIDNRANMLEIQIAENMVRTDMTMKEKATVVKKIYDEIKMEDPEKGYSIVADRCNVSKSYIAKLVKIAEGRYKGRVGGSGVNNKSDMTIDEAKNFISNIQCFNAIDGVDGSGLNVEPTVTILDEEIKTFERMIALLKNHKKRILQKKLASQEELETPPKAEAEGVMGAKKRGRPRLVSQPVSLAEIDRLIQREVKSEKGRQKSY